MENKLAMLDIWEEEEQMMERLGRRSKNQVQGRYGWMDERDMEKEKGGRGVDNGNNYEEGRVDGRVDTQGMEKRNGELAGHEDKG